MHVVFIIELTEEAMMTPLGMQAMSRRPHASTASWSQGSSERMQHLPSAPRPRRLSKMGAAVSCPRCRFNVLPVEPGWLRAVVELLITSEWLGLGFRTLRYDGCS